MSSTGAMQLDHLINSIDQFPARARFMEQPVDSGDFAGSRDRRLILIAGENNARHALPTLLDERD